MRGQAERLRARVAAAPLWAHGLAVALALMALVPIVGTQASYSADEGAAIIQARSLARGDGWIIDHPLSDIDPDGSLYPLELSTAGADGVAAYAKHPLYPLLLATADRAGGHLTMVLLSVVGTWLAAFGACHLAGAILGGHRRMALWMTAIGTPLLFNGYWVIAHSLGAAAVAGAAIAVWRVASGKPRPWGAVVMAPALIVGATLLRSEALLFAASLSVVAGVFGLWRRRAWPVLLSPLLAASAYWAHRIDAAWEQRVVGGAVSSTGPFEPRNRTGGPGARIDGFIATWLRPSPSGDDVVTAVLVLGSAILIVLSIVLVFRRRADLALALGASAVVLLVIRHVGWPAAPIPGLLVAFPLVAAIPACLLHRGDGDVDGVRVVAGVLALSWAGVVATQYPEGGVAEWGGRYFALGLPLAVPLVVGGLAALLATVPERKRFGVVLTWGAATLLVAALSARELARVHDDTASLLDDIAEMAAGAGPRRVVVTDEPAIPRLDWRRFDEHSWLLVRSSEVPDLPARLAEGGERRWVLVSADPSGFLAAYPQVRVVSEAREGVLLVEGPEV